MALIEQMVVNFKNVIHELPTVGEDGKYEPFVSNSPKMVALNMSDVDVGATRPMHKLLRARNLRMFNLLARHLTLIVSANSHTVPEVMPESHLKKPDSDILMRHDQSGTEVRVLENPHLPHSHYLAYRMCWIHNHHQMIQWLMEGTPPQLK